MMHFLKKNTLIVIYNFIFFFICYGVWVDSKWSYFSSLSVFFLALNSFYFSLQKLNKKHKIKGLYRKFIPTLQIEYLFVISVLIIVSHIVSLGQIPTLKAMTLTTNDEVALVRQNISIETSLYMAYLSSFTIKAILPFSILILLIKKRKILYITLIIVACIYAFSLMQKSTILTILLPTLIYAFIKKDYLNAFISSTLVITLTIALTYIANPAISTTKIKQTETNRTEIKTKNESSSITKVLIGLKKRIILVPGKMVSIWFKHIPANLPYLGINGYGFISKIRGLNHHEYGKEMYPLVYQKQEIKGTLNAASFMYDYANFGLKGLVFSGLLLAISFLFIESIFKGYFTIKLSLNLYSILVLSSSSLTTLLFSGGWSLIVILFYLYKEELKYEEQ